MLIVGKTGDLAACVALRRAVFVEEQGVPEPIEQDGRDCAAHHMLAVLNGQPVGTARILLDAPTGKIGRVCVLREHRGRGIGRRLIRTGVAELRALGMRRAELGAQTHALKFYESLGFTVFGPEFSEAGGQPHRMMGMDL